MAKTNNDTNETLSRLTVLGTILVPMNLVTGLWVSLPPLPPFLTFQGMNVLVPGQNEDHPNLTYFFASISPPFVPGLTRPVLACLIAFALFAVFSLRKVGLV